MTKLKPISNRGGKREHAGRPKGIHTLIGPRGVPTKQASFRAPIELLAEFRRLVPIEQRASWIADAMQEKLNKLKRRQESK